jgi:hypothetical protein
MVSGKPIDRTSRNSTTLNVTPFASATAAPSRDNRANRSLMAETSDATLTGRSTSMQTTEPEILTSKRRHIVARIS